jgi:hypothetical protein
MWPQDGPELKTISLEGADAIPTIFDDVPEAIDTTLRAKVSQSEIKHDNGLAGLADRAKARKARNAIVSANVHVVEKQPSVIDLTVDENASETSSICKSSRHLSLTSHSDTFQPRSVVRAAPSLPGPSSMALTMISKNSPQ